MIAGLKLIGRKNFISGSS